jgi:hypothetical protein
MMTSHGALFAILFAAVLPGGGAKWGHYTHSSGNARRRTFVDTRRRRTYYQQPYARRRGSHLPEGAVGNMSFTHNFSFADFRRRRLPAAPLSCHAGYFHCPKSNCCDSNANCRCDDDCQNETKPGNMTHNASHHGIDSELGCAYAMPYVPTPAPTPPSAAPSAAWLSSATFSRFTTTIVAVTTSRRW